MGRVGTALAAACLNAIPRQAGVRLQSEANGRCNRKGQENVSKTLERQIQRSRHAGRELALAIQEGYQITPVDCPIRLRSGEVCVGTTNATLLQHIATEAQWTEKRGGGWGLG